MVKKGIKTSIDRNMLSEWIIKHTEGNSNYQSLKESLHDLEIEHRRMKAAFEEQIKAREALRESNAALIEALEWVVNTTPAQLRETKIVKDYLKPILNKAKNINQ